MKTINVIIKSLLALGLLLGISSCKKYEYEEVIKTFKVLETNYSDSRNASEGFIRVNEEGFTVTTDAVGGWLKAELVEPTLVKVLIAQNSGEEARTANVILTKGNEVERVPIMQLGVRNFIKGFKDIIFERDGGQYALAMQTDSPAKVNVEYLTSTSSSSNWLEAEIKDGKLVLIASELPKGAAGQEAKLTIEAGLFKKTVLVKQIWGKPKYADVIGKYLLDYAPKAGDAKVQTEVEIKQDKLGESFMLIGLAAPIKLTWDKETYSLIIPLGKQKTPASFKKTEVLMLTAAGLGYKNADGSENFDLNWSKPYFPKGQWVDTTTDANMMFTFAPSGEEGKNKLHGLLLWKRDVEQNKHIKDYKGEDDKGIASISDFSLTKKQ